MNGSGSKIEIFKPFGESFELMKKILFQPFDLKKWPVIGFAAWVANLGGGGGDADFNYPDNRREEVQKLNETIGQIPQPVLITGILRSDLRRPPVHCPVCVATRARAIYFRRLYGSLSRRDYRSVKGISYRRKQLLPFLTARGA